MCTNVKHFKTTSTFEQDEKKPVVHTRTGQELTKAIDATLPKMKPPRWWTLTCLVNYGITTLMKNGLVKWKKIGLKGDNSSSLSFSRGLFLDGQSLGVRCFFSLTRCAIYFNLTGKKMLPGASLEGHNWAIFAVRVELFRFEAHRVCGLYEEARVPKESQGWRFRNHQWWRVTPFVKGEAEKLSPLGGF